MTATELIELISLTGHCSALIKWLPGEDLLVSHTTWDDYTEMLRVYKHYDFHVCRLPAACTLASPRQLRDACARASSTTRPSA
jgi:hypothetical protein